MKSLGSRILLLIAGGSLLLAATLAAIVHFSYRSYYAEVVGIRAANFAERILALEPDIWSQYQNNKDVFTERLKSMILFEPNTGLYVISLEGKVIAAASEGKIFWSSYTVDLKALHAAAESDGSNAVYGSDPDMLGSGCIVSARPIVFENERKAWLYVVARGADLSYQVPDLVKSYAVRGAIKIALITLAIGLLMTASVLTLLAKPLSALTRSAENIRGTHINPTQFPFSERNDEIGRLSRAFSSMVNRLQVASERILQTDSSRREMVASVSHDLRTPLTAIIGQLQTLSMKQDSLSTDDRARYLNGALLNAEHLRRLTDAIAELAKLDNPELKANCEASSAGDLIDDIVQRFQSRAETLHISLVTQYPERLPFAWIDIQLLERALANLIDNALRVVPPGGKISVELERPHDAPFINLVVRDNGPGIAAQDLNNIFVPFYQTAKHRDHRGASGLGLAIVARVAELHGSSAKVTSEPGKGSAFSIQLPVHQKSNSANSIKL
jgi:signal transduction histidine kinase